MHLLGSKYAKIFPNWEVIALRRPLAGFNGLVTSWQ